MRNDPEVPPGHLLTVAALRSIEVDLVRLDEGDPLPELASVEAVVVLGGAMGVYDGDRYPYLDEERVFLAEAVAREIPVLGLCLGCQLLADALGGSAYLAPHPEVAFARITIVHDDPVVEELAETPSMMIHRDTWDLPPGGTLIATSHEYRQAFRLGSALGVQTHPEVDIGILRAWLDSPDGTDLFEGAGVDRDELRASFAAASGPTAATAVRFFGAWFDEALRTTG